MKPFPWDNVMKFGLGTLGLAPGDFWTMTPRELSAAYDAIVQNSQSKAPIVRHELTGLMARFPDEENEK
ncbi:MAG: phage tail assembly chaperone [Devosiaceae bacterium]|nr:phage tail assembly chaperone [Devosiaceae bacterium]